MVKLNINEDIFNFGLEKHAVWKYLKFLARHKWYVFQECCKLGIPVRGLLHDMSKFRKSEFIAYEMYFYGTWFDNKEWGGDRRDYIPFECTVRGVQEALDLAWLKHQKRNPHHWQYWVLHEDDGDTKVLDMPMKYRKEMLADWIGAGKAIWGEKSDTREWYLENYAHMKLHPKTQSWIEKQLGIPEE